MHIKEVFVSILACHSPPDRKIKLIPSRASPSDLLWRSNHSYRRLSPKLVLPDIPEHCVNKRVSNRQKFRLSITDRRRPVESNHLEALRNVLGTQTLRRQELHESVFALHLSALLCQEF